MEKNVEIERSIIKKYRKEIWKRFIAGINEYEMIKPSDKIAVCISGGKDSMLLAKCIQHLQKHSDFPFEAEYMVLDPGYTDVNRKKIIENAKLLDIKVVIYLSTYPPRWIVDNLLINGWWKTQIVDKWISHPHSQSYQQ